MPPSSGERIQDTAIFPISPQCTMAKPPVPVTRPVVTAAPTMPPMIACVVETGQPILVASSSHTAAPSRADIMISAKASGSIAIPSRSTMPLRTVSVTEPPASTAPDTSKTAATTSACFIVRVPAPTLVPKEFATSLPPMLNAMNSPNAIARINRKVLTSVPVWVKAQIVNATTVARVISPAPTCQLRSGPRKPWVTGASVESWAEVRAIVAFPG